MVGTTAKYIYTVYRLKSFSLAAQELFLSQPAMSRAIKKAELELGAPIFNRKTIPISLTDEGKIYIDTIEKMLQMEQDAIENIHDSKTLIFYNVQDEPFSVYGVFFENEKYRRLPQQVAKDVSKHIYSLHANTSGGRVRFTTDSSVIAIKAIVSGVEKAPHFTLAGIAGFDMYIGEKPEYYATFLPPVNISNGYERIIHFNNHAEREITINFPLYCEVTELYIGLENNAVLKKAPEYKHKKPIVFYGSSITQGGCASRPGNAYENIISRTLDTDYICLGFSGATKVADEFAKYIKNLDMSVFVCDYDNNAPSLKYLEETHRRMFSTVRQANPELPIILLSCPKYRLNKKDQKHLAVIRKTYDDAIASGDNNVYFIDGPTLMKYAGSDGTVDGIHPNDLGFHSIARVLIQQLKPLL